MRASTAIQAGVDAVQIIDTHEHLEEESTRLARPRDWSYLFSHYANDDLAVAGMPPADLERFLGAEPDIHEKWRLFAPVWPKAENTGYCMAVRLAVEELYGEPEIDAGSYARINEKMQALAQPGFYREILRRAGIQSCQVNALEAAVIRTETDREVLLQDLSGTESHGHPTAEREGRSGQHSLAPVGDADSVSALFGTAGFLREPSVRSALLRHPQFCGKAVSIPSRAG